MQLKIKVEDKIAKPLNDCLICGNSDYTVKFIFDEEWEQHTIKFARFIWNKQYVDVEFTGDTCEVPVIYKTDTLAVGVYAGELRTTTPAIFACRRSILCEEVIEHTLTPSEYEEIMQLLNNTRSDLHALSVAVMKIQDQVAVGIGQDIAEVRMVAYLAEAKAKDAWALANTNAEELTKKLDKSSRAYVPIRYVSGGKDFNTDFMLSGSDPNKVIFCNTEKALQTNSPFGSDYNPYMLTVEKIYSGVLSGDCDLKQTCMAVKYAGSESAKIIEYQRTYIGGTNPIWTQWEMCGQTAVKDIQDKIEKMEEDFSTQIKNNSDNITTLFATTEHLQEDLVDVSKIATTANRTAETANNKADDALLRVAIAENDNIKKSSRAYVPIRYVSGGKDFNTDFELLSTDPDKVIFSNPDKTLQANSPLGSDLIPYILVVERVKYGTLEAEYDSRQTYIGVKYAGSESADFVEYQRVYKGGSNPIWSQWEMCGQTAIEDVQSTMANMEETLLAKIQGNDSDIVALHAAIENLQNSDVEFSKNIATVNATANIANGKADQALARNEFTDAEKSKLAGITNPMVIKGRVNTVADLPTTAQVGWFYFVGTEGASSFEEYCYGQNGWEFIGETTTGVDLSDYYTKAQVDGKFTAADTQLNAAIDMINLNSDDIEAVQNEVTVNKNNISALQTAVQTNTDNIGIHENEISILNSNVSSLQNGLSATVSNVAKKLDTSSKAYVPIRYVTGGKDFNTDFMLSATDPSKVIFFNSDKALQTNSPFGSDYNPYMLTVERVFTGTLESEIELKQTCVGVKYSGSELAETIEYQRFYKGVSDIWSQWKESGATADKTLLSKITQNVNDIAINKTTLGYQKKNLINAPNVTLTDVGYAIQFLKCDIPAGTYIFSYDTTAEEITCEFGLINNITTSKKTYQQVTGHNEIQITTTEKSNKTYLFVNKAGDYSNFMIRNADITDNTFEPYVEDVNTRIALNKSTLGYQKKNLMKLAYAPGYTHTNNAKSVTWTFNSDYSVSMVVTTALTSGMALEHSRITLQPGTYIYSVEGYSTPSITHTQLYKMNADGSGTFLANLSAIENTITVTEETTYSFRAYRNSAVTVNVTEKFYPMLRYADITDSTFEPYVDDVDTRIVDNKNDIATNKNDIAINQTTLGYTKKNLLPIPASSLTVNNVTLSYDNEGYITSNTSNDLRQWNHTVANNSVFLKAGTYIYSTHIKTAPTSNGHHFAQAYDENDNHIFACSLAGNNISRFTLTEDKTIYIVEKVNNGCIATMIRKADITDNTYEPYVESIDERLNKFETQTLLYSDSTAGKDSPLTVTVSGLFTNYSAVVCDIATSSDRYNVTLPLKYIKSLGTETYYYANDLLFYYVDDNNIKICTGLGQSNPTIGRLEIISLY